MEEKRRQYTRNQDRSEAVRLLNESGRSKAQITRELGIHDSLLTKAFCAFWRGLSLQELGPATSRSSLIFAGFKLDQRALRPVKAASKSARVYPCCGAPNTVWAGPTSSTTPSFITTMSFASARTTRRSWLIKI